MTCDAFDVVVVPFPFNDSALTVRRPALVLSRTEFNCAGYSVMAMITDRRNKPWPLDVPVDPAPAGLTMPCVVRMKFFTLDNGLIIRRIGSVGAGDRESISAALRRLLPQ